MNFLYRIICNITGHIYKRRTNSRECKRCGHTVAVKHRAPKGAK